MENGLNVANCNVKDPRSYIRLNSIRDKTRFFSMKFKEIYDLDKITDITEDQLIKFFTNMRKGNIVSQDGKRYASTAYFVKIFKAFWHWWIKVNKKKGVEIPDITNDLDTSQDKPKWVYLDETQVRKLADNAKYDYKVLIMFLFDTGIRAPTELINIKVSDLFNDCKELQIRDEVSKTFGRKIKLMVCHKLLKNYVLGKELKKEDYLFPINPKVVNRYLKRLASKVLGEIQSEADAKLSDLTMYDFRHISTCYWLPRYKSKSALKFRFGWKKSDKMITSNLDEIGIPKSSGAIRIVFNHKLKQIGVWFIFNKKVSLKLAEENFIFNKGDRILLMISYKAKISEFKKILGETSFNVKNIFISKEKDYALVLCKLKPFNISSK